MLNRVTKALGIAIASSNYESFRGFGCEARFSKSWGLCGNGGDGRRITDAFDDTPPNQPSMGVSTTLLDSGALYGDGLSIEGTDLQAALPWVPAATQESRQACAP